jgi:two-component system chemotaxis response regulator CheY
VRILLVDDSSAMRSFVARTLKDLGYTDISMSETSTDALTRIQAEEWGLVLLDWHMPNMDGLELLKHMRTVLNNKTPVIMLTVEQEREKVALAIRTGADDYIIKPLNRQTLAEKINKIKEKYGSS